MAEEIIYEWTNATDLVLEVMGAVDEGDAPTLHKLWGLLADPSLVASHRFSLIDSNGQRVEFPLKLISDTSIRSMADR